VGGWGRPEEGDGRQWQLLPIEVGDFTFTGSDPERARRFVESGNRIGWRKLLGDQGGVERYPIQAGQAA
jgi:hypothetical protein